MSDQKRKEIQALVASGVKAAQAYDRTDLADRLTKLQAKASRPDTPVAVLGQFKQGKSSLVNALVGADVCPVDDDIATAVPTFVRFGDPSKAYALVPDPTNPDGRREPISMEQLSMYTTERGLPDAPFDVKGVEVQVPRKLLQNGLTFVDTPGVGGLGSAYATAGLGTLSIAEIGMFVTDASQELTRAEVDYLQQAYSLCSNMAMVVTKIDLYPAWRRVIEINQNHLKRAGLNIKIFPVSSHLRKEAIKRSDKKINEESGCAELVRELRTTYVQRRESHAWASAASEVRSVCKQLSSKLEAELAVVENPDGSQDLVANLQTAKARSESLKSNLSRWQITLNDGIQELTSDVDHDFRQRIRNITFEADQAIEEADPLNIWQEFEPWLVDAVSKQVVANYQFLTERSAHLSSLVAQHFVDDGGDMLHQLQIYTGDQPMERVKQSVDLELEKVGAGGKGFAMFKGSYSGMLMATVLGGYLAVGPLAPVLAVGVGLVMGRKSLKDEKARGIKQRTSEAKVAVRRYCEEVQFQIGKDSRDTCRAVNRQLREHYNARAQELSRSVADALAAASKSARSSEAERNASIANLKAELQRVGDLAAKCSQVLKAELASAA